MRTGSYTGDTEPELPGNVETTCVTQPHPRSQIGRLRTPTARRATIALGLLVIVATVGVYARNSGVLSLYDEVHHLDYAVKAGNFELPSDDNRFGDTAMREVACRGIDWPGWRLADGVLPPCATTRFDPNVFPDSGFNTAAAAIPGYYFPSGLIARGLEAATPVSSPLLAVRLVSAFWLGAGLVVFALLGREFEARPLTLVIVAVLLASTPVVFIASSHATPDSMLLLSGGLIMLATVKWLKGTVGLWAPCVAALSAIMIDQSNFLALALAGVFALTPFVAGAKISVPRLPHKSRPVDPTTATVTLAIVILACLVLLRVAPIARELLTGSTGGVTVALPRFETQQRPGFSREVLLGSFTNMVSPANEVYRPDVASDLTFASLTSVVNWLVIAGALGTAAWAPVASLQRRLGGAATTVMLLSGPLVAGATWLSGGLFFTLPARYGLPLLPALGVTLALSLRGKLITFVVGAIAVSQFALFGYRALMLG